MYLEEILEPDELHLVDMLINEVKIYIRVGATLSEKPIVTNTGICQGNCLCAVLFIYYLACSLTTAPKLHDHSYSKQPEDEVIPAALTDHQYTKLQPDSFYIAPKYVDDVTWITTSKELVEKIKKEIPPSSCQATCT